METTDYLTALDNLTSAIIFKGCVDIDKEDPSNYKLGDIIVDSQTQATYIMVGEPNGWELLQTSLPSDGTINDKYTEDDVEIELKDIKCDACGAPIKIKSKYDSNVKCEYCGSEYSITRR